MHLDIAPISTKIDKSFIREIAAVYKVNVINGH